MSHKDVFTSSEVSPETLTLRAAEYVRMSTEHQRYSIENQSEAIRTYASQHGMAVVRTYMDYGKSGLHVHGREGLKTLIADVESRAADFAFILVYDISRWGRFQDSDESAYYEQVCKRAGVRVMYCAEPFENDDSPMTGVIKSIRRAMAGEYSRSLSARVWAGKARIAQMGYRQGGPAGYGLRRMLVDRDGKHKGELQFGERKSIQSDHVTLVPGPPEEVITVQRIYELFLSGMGERDIANRLNEEVPRRKDGIIWGRRRVKGVLTNEKYIGLNVFNKESGKLLTSRKPNSAEKWVLREKAFESIVSRELFDQVQQEYARRATVYTDDFMLQKLTDLLSRKGELSVKVISNDLSTPCVQAYTKRFGGIDKAYAAVGWCRLRRPADRETTKFLKKLRMNLIEEVASGFLRAGATVSRDNILDNLVINGRCTVSVAVVRSLKHHGGPRWAPTIREKTSGELIVMIRMHPGNETIKDTFLVPKADLATLPVCLTPSAPSIGKYRIESLQALYGLARAL